MGVGGREGPGFTRCGGAGVLALALAGASGCAVVHAPADGVADAGPAFDGEPTIRAGTGCVRFFSWEPLEDGARLPLEPGGSGADHFWVGVRGWNLELDPWLEADVERQRTTRERTFYRVRDEADGSVLVEQDLGPLRLWPTPELGPVPHRTNLGLVFVDVALRRAVLDATLTVEVERVHDGERMLHRVEGVTAFEAEPCVPPDAP